MTPVLKTRARVILVAFGLCALTARGAFAGAHTWDVNEIFTNADGTVQFIELREAGGGAFEVGVGGHLVTSNDNSVTIGSNVASPTSFKTILFGTLAYDALPNSPTPDYFIDPNFFAISGDTITYNPYDSITFPAGSIPTDGVLSVNRNLVSGVNSPTNYAGQTGSVNAAPPPTPPGVPDGKAGSTPMTVTATDVTGSSLTLNWGNACAGATRYHIVYGSRADLPAAPGGAFSVDGGACGIGPTMPFVWNGVPGDTDGSGLLWWLILSDDGGTVEGSWGKASSGVERAGTGPGGVSGVCSMATRNVTNVCGH
jgi:hypothetical protein